MKHQVKKYPNAIYKSYNSIFKSVQENQMQQPAQLQKPILYKNFAEFSYEIVDFSDEKNEK